MKKILHPTDFSKNAAQALKFAYALAQKHEAELIVVHVSDVPTIMNSADRSSFRKMEDEKAACLEDHLEDYCAEHIDGSVTTTDIWCEARLCNSTVRGLLEAIHEHQPDLVVMGTRGYSNFRERLMGSTTKKLIAEANCPVLAVPEQAKAGAFREIVYASDFDLHDGDVVKSVAAFAAKYDAHITILHVFPKSGENAAEEALFERQLNEQLPHAHLKYATRVDEHTNEAIGSYVQEDHADLLVMYEKDHASLIDRLFHRDRVQQFANHTDVPLLSFNRQALTSRTELL